jgi:hypothetical protein
MAHGQREESYEIRRHNIRISPKQRLAAAPIQANRRAPQI